MNDHKSTQKYYFLAHWFSTIVMLTMLAVSSASADERAVLKHIESFRDGSNFFQRDEYRKAALAWSNQRAAILAKESSKTSTLAAAFASVLASIAYDRAEDALAYSEWGNGVKHYMAAGTSWEEQQIILFNYLTDVKEQLNAAANDEGGLYIDTDLQFLIALDGLVGFSVFKRPGIGLTIQGAEQDLVVTENRNYFARPLSVVQQDDTVEQGVPHIDQLSAALHEASDVELPMAAVSDEPTVAATAVPADPLLLDSRAVIAPLVDEVDPPVTNEMVAAITIHASALPAVDRRLSPAPLTSANAMAEPATSSRTDQPLQQPTPKVEDDISIESYTLTASDQAKAQRAWSYIERNYQQSTGFSRSNELNDAISGWDMAGHLAALVAAHQLALIDGLQFDGMISAALGTLNRLPLYADRQPNRSYSVVSGEMLDRHGRGNDRGYGWSAIDTGRLLLWLRVLASWYPQLTDSIISVVERWDFSEVIANGQLHSLLDDNGKHLLRQEGRLGYEQYAASGFALWGLDVSRALAMPYTHTVKVFDVNLSVDRRPSSYVTSDPFVLGAIEMGGVNDDFSRVADEVYQVQKQRWLILKKLTAMGEDIMYANGQFISNYVYNADGGTAFKCAGINGANVDQCQIVSSKIAYGWDAVYGDRYSEALLSIVEKGIASSRGYFAGVYEDLTINRALTLDTNSIVLVSLLYKFRRGAPFIRLLDVTKPESAPADTLISRGAW